MNSIIENIIGMNTMTDQVIATDFLNAAKTGVKMYALAITETHKPEVRSVLKSHLADAIATHEKASNYMVSKGWYHPKDIKAQIELDMKNAETALKLPELS